jgi:hypothetical protein
MTRTPFDQFAKQFFEAFLSPLGEVKTNFEVPGEPKFVDIWFAPSSQPSTDTELGILGIIATKPCLLEPFRNQPNQTEVRSCLFKLFHVQAEFQRQDDEASEDDLPKLWIITSSASQKLLSGFGASPRKGWLKGIYFFPAFFRTAIIAVNKLPRTPETIWLRILGKGATQQGAISEFLSLTANDARRSTVLKLLATWKISMEASAEIELEDRELVMTLSQAYLEWEQETERRGMEQGIQQGIQQGQRILLENLLKARFGVLDEQLAAIIQPILELSPQDYASLLLQLSNLEREDLLARFQ